MLVSSFGLHAAGLQWAWLLEAGCAQWRGKRPEHAGSGPVGNLQLVLLCQFLRSWHMTCVYDVASLICSVLFWFSTSVRSKSLTSLVLLCAPDQRCPLPRLRSHMRLPSFLRKKLRSLNIVRTMMIIIAVTWQQFMAARLLPALARRWQGFSGKHLHI